MYVQWYLASQPAQSVRGRQARSVTHRFEMESSAGRKRRRKKKKKKRGLSLTGPAGRPTRAGPRRRDPLLPAESLAEPAPVVPPCYASSNNIRIQACVTIAVVYSVCVCVPASARLSLVVSSPSIHIIAYPQSFLMIPPFPCHCLYFVAEEVPAG